MVIVNIIYSAFLVWLLSFVFALPESLWESRKNKIEELVSKQIFNIDLAADSLPLRLKNTEEAQIHGDKV